MSALQRLETCLADQRTASSYFAGGWNLPKELPTLSAHRHCPTSAPPALLQLVSTLLTSGNVHWQSAAVVGLGCLAHCNDFVLDSASRLLRHSAVSLSFHNCPPVRLSAAGQGLLSTSSPGLRAAVGWSLKQVSSMLPLLPLSEVNQRVPVLGLLGVVAQVW